MLKQYKQKEIMANLVYKKITSNSTINVNAQIRRYVKNNYENYIVIGYDDDELRYILKSENGLPEYYGLQVRTTTQDLIENFEVLEEE
jgi:hypothetical protein